MKIDIELLKRMEHTIDTSEPEKSEIPIKILGYGEISLVFEIVGDPHNIAYKRIPIFDTESQVKRHIWAYNAYNQLLKKIGLLLPEYDVAWFKDARGTIQFYCIQEKIHPDSVANKIIHHLSDREIYTLVRLVLREFKKVWSFNREHPVLRLGLDGQISNFAIKDYETRNLEITESTKLYYLDTSTPMLRINGKEAMQAVLFLKSAPSFLRGLLKALFLQDTVDRYYDLRRVTIDLIANFFKEQKAELIPNLIRLTNAFFDEELSEFNIASLELEEIRKYYKSDVQMWEIFQRVRKFDRFLKTRVFRKQYNFYLPGKIER